MLACAVECFRCTTDDRDHNNCHHGHQDSHHELVFVMLMVFPPYPRSSPITGVEYCTQAFVRHQGTAAMIRIRFRLSHALSPGRQSCVGGRACRCGHIVHHIGRDWRPALHHCVRTDGTGRCVCSQCDYCDESTAHNISESTFADCWEILTRLELLDAIPPNVRQRLENGVLSTALLSVIKYD